MFEMFASSPFGAFVVAAGLYLTGLAGLLARADGRLDLKAPAIVAPRLFDAFAALGLGILLRHVAGTIDGPEAQAALAVLFAPIGALAWLQCRRFRSTENAGDAVS